MILDLLGIKQLIPTDQYEMPGCGLQDTLVAYGRAGKEIECSFNGAPITFDVYREMLEWMHSNLTWEQWLEERKIYKPTGKVVEADAVVVEAVSLLGTGRYEA